MRIRSYHQVSRNNVPPLRYDLVAHPLTDIIELQFLRQRKISYLFVDGAYPGAGAGRGMVNYNRHLLSIKDTGTSHIFKAVDDYPAGAILTQAEINIGIEL